MLTEERAQELFDLLATFKYDKSTFFAMLSQASEMATESEICFFLTEGLYRFRKNGCDFYEFEDEFRKYSPWKKICVRYKPYMFTPDWEATKQMNFRRNPVWDWAVKK